MRNYCMRFWYLFLVFLFASLLAGCDVENVEYEDDDTYALFDRPGMAPSNSEVQEALDIIAAGGPIGSIPGAYATLMAFLEVTLDEVSLTTFTVEEISDILGGAGVDFCRLNIEFIVIKILKAAIEESQKPDFDSEAPENSSLLGVVESLDNLGISDADQIDGDTILTCGDYLLLVTSIHQSLSEGLSESTGALINRWAVIVDDILSDNYCASGMILPSLEELISSTTCSALSMPHQGEIN